MIVGIHQRAGDLSVNVCKTKQLTNMRSAGARAPPTSHCAEPSRVRWPTGASLTAPARAPCPRAAACRAAGKDKDDGVVPKVEFSLDSCLEYIANDELVEVTPESIRMLKNPEMGKKRK